MDIDLAEELLSGNLGFFVLKNEKSPWREPLETEPQWAAAVPEERFEVQRTGHTFPGHKRS
ncbi:MAG TPA: hypothetical protein PLF96_14090, partial [Thermotogota bacterium]|nr:hypothetical protein [Thermotogota bacterium]